MRKWIFKCLKEKKDHVTPKVMLTFRDMEEGEEFNDWKKMLSLPNIKLIFFK